MDSLLTLLGLAFISGLIVLANYHEKQSQQAWPAFFLKLGLLFVIGMIIFLGFIILNAALVPQEDIPVIELDIATSFFAASILTALFCLALVFSMRLRLFLQNFFFQADNSNRYFNAYSSVHLTAIIIIAFAILNTTGNFILGGGVEGMAETLQESTMGASDLLLNMSLYLTGAFLGVGVLIRRNVKQSFQRLGIEFSLRKNLEHILIGAFIGFGLFWIQVLISSIWQASVSPETLSEQTAAAEQIFAAFSGSLWLGFLVAATAGIGEELLFRGALQPIFGNLLVSLFFVSLHSQYTFTPASLIILVVSLAFGLLRQNYSTNAAIIAHFVYNFSPFVLVYLAAEAGLTF